MKTKTPTNTSQLLRRGTLFWFSPCTLDIPSEVCEISFFTKKDFYYILQNYHALVNFLWYIYSLNYKSSFFCAVIIPSLIKWKLRFKSYISNYMYPSTYNKCNLLAWQQQHSALKIIAFWRKFDLYLQQQTTRNLAGLKILHIAQFFKSKKGIIIFKTYYFWSNCSKPPQPLWV